MDREHPVDDRSLDDLSPPARNHRRALIGQALALYALAFLARALWIAFSGIPEPVLDALEYLTLARNLATGHGFTVDDLTPHLYRPPLFSGLLATWFLVTGTSSTASAALFQVLANSLASPLVLGLAGALGLPRRGAVAAALFTALYPYGFINIALPLQEYVMAPLITVGLWMSLRFLGKPTVPSATIAGLCLGLAALAKAPHLLLPWVLVATAWLFRKSPGAGFRTGPLAAMFLVAHLVVAPWTIRNYVATGGDFVPVNAQGTGVWLWAACDGDCGDLRDTLSDPPAAPYVRQSPGFFTRGDANGAAAVQAANESALSRGLSGSALDGARRTAARQYILEHPERYASHLAKVTVLTLSPAARPGLFLASYPIRMVVMFLVHLPLFGALLWGLVHGWRHRRAGLFATCTFTSACVLVYALTLTGEGRQVIPFLPFLAALIPAAWQSLPRVSAGP